ncbi:galactose-1-phosphate uridylyltransferase [Thermobrachium celere]|uniref:galactose-1-phosphate uridylyltransferase n=1 Tax=Thermobrachium celere TaxID=53422 RepID=UPI0019409C19|nr:galactose-1-phosphate uridylyltransferase [Thermobrachium celere]GFR34627.1 galactose-1-phosphate uridylyltransferase [Thermobrachium celere]
MSNFRISFETGEQVIYSAKRAARPKDFNYSDDINSLEHKKDCPFCVGNEENTPPTVYKVGEPWIMRVVENKFPAVTMNTDEFVKGIHYVVIESNKHNRNIDSFDFEELEKLIRLYITVASDMYKNPEIQYVQIFKNYKREAGASLEHPHSQIIGVNFIPNNILKELDISRDYYYGKESCIYCDEIEKEIVVNKRIVIENEHFIVICPYASMYQYQTQILPKRHISSLFSLTDAEIKSLSAMLKDLLNRYRRCLGDIAYNMYFHFISKEVKEYHLHIDICPRTNIHAGFEISTGAIINSVYPEDAAELLKSFDK